MCLALIVLVLPACATSPGKPASDASKAIDSSSILVASYKMSVGDQIKVNVWKNPELSVSEPIRPDGKVSLPLVGDVMAAGKTPEELAGDIESKLATYVKNPNVTVIVTDLRGHSFLSRVRVTGAVAHNVSMQYHQGMTVLDAVLEAGGVDIYADANRTKLHRRTEDGQVSYDIHLRDIMQNGDMSTNIPLMPGDVITVPESRF